MVMWRLYRLLLGFFCVGHVVTEIDELWQQISCKVVFRMGWNLEA